MPKPIYGATQGEETFRLKGLSEGAAAGLGQAQGAQMAALGQMQGMATGQGPSLAQAQLAAQSQQNVANQMAMAAQGRGGNLGAQARQAAGAGAAGAMAQQQQMAQLRAQEQMAAIQGAGSLSSQMAGQSLQQQLGIEGLLGSANMGQMQTASDYELRSRELAEMERQGKFDRISGGIGMGMQAAGSLAMMSDERVKTDIGPGNIAASQAVAEIPPKTFEYAPGYGEPGQRVGVMAQDLQRTPEGAAIVRDTPYGKEVDVGGLASLGVAASSDQERRLRALEAQLGAGEGPGLGSRDFRPPIGEPDFGGPREMTMDQVGRALTAEPGAAGALSEGERRSVLRQMMGPSGMHGGGEIVSRDPVTGEPVNEFGEPMGIGEWSRFQGLGM